MSPSRLAFLLPLLLLAAALWAAPLTYGVLLPDDGFPGPRALDAAKAAGAQYVVIRANWPRIQPTALAWCFAELDAAVDAARDRGLTVVLTLGPAPRWTVRYLQVPSDVEVARAKPDLAALQAYAAKLAERYQGRVRYYRLWEPPTAAVLLAVPRDVYALYRAAAAAIHGVDGLLQVIAPEPGDVNLDWIAGYLGGAKGAAAPDILALTPGRWVKTAAEFRWRCHVLRNRVLPADAPALWAEIPAGDDGELAAAAVQDGMIPVLFSGDPGACLARVGHPAKTLAPVPPPVKTAAVALDASGRSALAIRPLPDLPGGHYTVECINGKTVLETVMDSQPWIHFDVPDGFLFYNRECVPVEVTVRVRGAAYANKTGFNLYYDAIGGMNNTPWQWIAVGPEAEFTYTFRLKDALFANREGYDFRVCMGGSVEPVRVVGVTIKKVRL